MGERRGDQPASFDLLDTALAGAGEQGTVLHERQGILDRGLVRPFDPTGQDRVGDRPQR